MSAEPPLALVHGRQETERRAFRAVREDTDTFQFATP